MSACYAPRRSCKIGSRARHESVGCHARSTRRVGHVVGGINVARKKKKKKNERREEKRENERKKKEKKKRRPRTANFGRCESRPRVCAWGFEGRRGAGFEGTRGTRGFGAPRISAREKNNQQSAPAPPKKNSNSHVGGPRVSCAASQTSHCQHACDELQWQRSTRKYD